MCPGRDSNLGSGERQRAVIGNASKMTHSSIDIYPREESFENLMHKKQS